MSNSRINSQVGRYNLGKAQKTVTYLGSGLSSGLRIIYVLVIFFPLLVLILWSLSREWFYPLLMPPELSTRAWEYLSRSSTGLGRAILNSSIIALSVVIINLMLALPAARVLARMKGPFIRFLNVLYTLPLIIPPLASALGIYDLFIRLRISDSILGVILIHLIPTLPYMILILRGSFANFSKDFEDQARSLGASSLDVLFKVTLPSLAPGIATGSFLVFIISWSEYLLTILVGGGRVITLPVLLYSFISSGDRELGAALSLIFLLPSFGIIFFSSRILGNRRARLQGTIGS